MRVISANCYYVCWNHFRWVGKFRQQSDTLDGINEGLVFTLRRYVREGYWFISRVHAHRADSVLVPVGHKFRI